MPLHAQTEQIVFGALTCQHDCVERKALHTRIKPRSLLIVQTVDAHILVVYGNLRGRKQKEFISQLNCSFR